MVCWGAEDIAQKLRVSRLVLRVVAIAVLLALSAVTYRQIGFWGDNMTLWSHALEVTRDNYLAENIVGSTLMDRGDSEAALPHFQNAVKENPPMQRPTWRLGPTTSSTGNRSRRLCSIKG